MRGCGIVGKKKFAQRKKKSQCRIASLKGAPTVAEYVHMDGGE